MYNLAMTEQEGKPRFFYPVTPLEDRKMWSNDRAVRGGRFTGTVGAFLVAGQYVYLMAERGVSPETVPQVVIGYALTTGVAAGIGAAVDGFRPTSRMVRKKENWPEITLVSFVANKIRNRRKYK